MTEERHGGARPCAWCRRWSRLIEAVGFAPIRQKWSHRVYRKGDSVLSLQDVRGQAKPYQIRQFLRTMDGQGLKLEGRDD